jgi:hypothetical protein
LWISIKKEIKMKNIWIIILLLITFVLDIIVLMSFIADDEPTQDKKEKIEKKTRSGTVISF